MDTLGKILADTKRSRDEALALIAGIQGGTVKLASGVAPATALEILRLNMADYDAIIARLGWRGNA